MGIDVLATISIIADVMIFGIIAVYLHAAAWTILFLLKAEWKPEYTMRILMAFACIAKASIFGYIFISSLLGHPAELSFIGATFIRPMIFLVGALIAADARLRYRRLTRGIGGEVWTLRKS